MMQGISDGLMHVIFGIGGVWLSLIDWASHRLPNQGVAFIGSLLVSCALLSREPAMLASAGGSALASAGVFALLAWLPPHALGWGDAKWQAVIGFYLGWWSPGLVIIQVSAALVLGGVAAGWLIWRGKLGPQDGVAFGPALVAGAACAMLLGKCAHII
jgi:leader peptidase (prepilin peptidase)/N-methyltransferase